MRFLICLFGLVFSFNAYPVTIEEIKNKRYDDFWEEIKAGGCFVADVGKMDISYIYLFFRDSVVSDNSHESSSPNINLWVRMIECNKRHSYYGVENYSEIIPLLIFDDNLEVMRLIYDEVGRDFFKLIIKPGYANDILGVCAIDIYKFYKDNSLFVNERLFIIPEEGCNIKLYKYFYEMGYLSYLDYLRYRFGRFMGTNNG